MINYHYSFRVNIAIFLVPSSKYASMRMGVQGIHHIHTHPDLLSTYRFIVLERTGQATGTVTN